MMNTSAINKIKPIIYSFMTKLHCDSDNENNFNTIVSDIDKTITTLFNQKDALYDKELLKMLGDKVSLNNMIAILKKAMAGKNEENKAQTTYALKQVIRLSNEAGFKQE